MKNALKTLLAVLLLPTLFLAVAQTARLLYGTLGNIKMFACFAGGAAVSGAIHFWVYDFSRVYVLGHELTHAVAALLCGYRIKDISVRQDSGYVKMTQCNAFVALAPYFIPAYSTSSIPVSGLDDQSGILPRIASIFIDKRSRRRISGLSRSIASFSFIL